MKNLISWMIQKCKHHLNLQIIFAYMLLLFLCFALLISIEYRLDGIGILAITGGILFLSFLLFHKSIKRRTGNGGNGGGAFQENMSRVSEALGSPNLMNQLITLGLHFMSFLCNNLDRLEAEQFKRLKFEIKNLERKIEEKEMNDRPSNRP